MKYQIRKWIDRAAGTYYDYGTFDTVEEANKERGELIIEANAAWSFRGPFHVVRVDADGNMLNGKGERAYA